MGRGGDGDGLLDGLGRGLSDPERRTLATYERAAASWSQARASGGDDFWAAELGELSKLMPQGRVLDIGSGHGRDARLLSAAGYQVSGVDISPALLELAKDGCPQAEFKVGSIYQLPFDDESFDAVWLAAVLLHLPKERAPQGVAEVKRVLRPGGAFFIAVKEGEGEKLLADEFGERFFAYYQDDELQRLLSASGLTVEQVQKRSYANTNWLCAFGRV